MNRAPVLLASLALWVTVASATDPTVRRATPDTAGRARAVHLTAPSYSGRWRLDTAKSDMGKRLPRSREDRMTEEGAWIRVTSTSIRAAGDTLLMEYRYRTDGEAVNTMRGQEVKTRGSRDGAALRFDSEAQLALFKFEVSERWSLSADGATLTQDRMSRSPLGDEKSRLVFHRAR